MSADMTDPAADPEALLAHAGFLEGLSRALVVEAADAEDLVQETWLAAIRRPPRNGARPADGAASRAWLVRVMKNLAATLYRRDTRRRVRERLAARGERLPGVAEQSAGERLAQELAAAVVRLAEPYRSAILHRFYDGLAPRDIARLHGLPIETVRTRIKRGISQLRAELELRHGAGGGWLALLPGLGADPLSIQPPLPAGTAGPAAANATLLGGAIVSTKTTAVSLGAAAILAAFSVTFYVQREEERKLARAERALREDGARKLSAAELAVKKLNGELAALEQARLDLAARLAAAQAIPPPPAAAPEPPEAPAETTPERRRELAEIAALEEADQLAAEFLARGDIQGLWLLAAQLLGKGPEGFAKVVELSRLLDGKEAREVMRLWHEDTMAGSFLRTLASHDEELLRFGLYLNGRNVDELPGFMREIRKEFAKDFGPMLLGFYEGADPEILGGYLEQYKADLTVAPQDPNRMSKIVRALGQIPTPEAADAILGVLERQDVPPEVIQAAVSSLAWQRDPRAKATLRALLERTAGTDPKLNALITAALRFLD
jgi:RNA polymerase sigma-70 factor (ECF subfamily)